MAGQGLQKIPFRIPEKWDAAWYLRHLEEVLSLADTRNAIEGSGITITGQPGETATISASDDLQNLLLQSYVLATPSGFLNFERILAGENGVVTIDDGGANADITVRIDTHGINLGKLAQLSNSGILGNPVDTVGEVQNINPAATLSVLHYTTGGGIEFDLIDHTYISDFNEAAQDAVGTIFVDSTSIDFTYTDATPSITASVNTANPSGVIGMTAVNGTAATPLRSDGRHAIDPAIAPSWTGRHTWTSANGSIELFGDSPFMIITGTAGTGPHWDFVDNSVAVNSRKWRDYVFGASRFFDICRDDSTTGRMWLQIDRGVDTVNALKFGNATNNPTYAFLGTGAASFSGAVNTATGMNVTGNGAFFNGANKFGLDFASSTARFYSSGPDNATRGSFDMRITDSAGTLDRSVLAIAPLGVVNVNRQVSGVSCMTVGQTATGDSIFYAIDTSTGASLRVGYNGTAVNYYDADTHNFREAGGAAQITVSTARSTFHKPVRLQGYTVATLPAGAAGDTAYVTDALAPVFGAAVAGGGAVTVPVYYTGAAWFVG